MFKHIQVVRFFDRTRNALVYLTYSDKLIEGSPKNSVSAVVIRDWPVDPASRRDRVGRRPVTLVGAARSTRRSSPAALALAPEAVAADGGGDVALPRRAAVPGGDRRHGLARRRGAAARGAACRCTRSPSRTSTDLEKCLYSVVAPLFIGLGFLGGRIDHHLAAMNALVRFADNPGGARRRRGSLLPLPAGVRDRPRAAGTRVSLFPMGPVRGRLSEGLRWPIAGLAFAPDGRIGTSNEATGGLVRVGFDAPRMLVILPAGLLEPVVDRLRGARERQAGALGDRHRHRLGHRDEHARARPLLRREAAQIGPARRCGG